MLLCIFQTGAGSARGVAQRAVTVKSETAKNCCRIFMTVHVRTRTWDRGHTGLLQGCPSFPPTSVFLPLILHRITSTTIIIIVVAVNKALHLGFLPGEQLLLTSTSHSQEWSSTRSCPASRPSPLDVLLQLTNPGGHEFMFV